MSNTRKKLQGGIRINPNTDALVNDGDINVDSSDNKLKVKLGGTDKTVATEDIFAKINKQLTQSINDTTQQTSMLDISAGEWRFPIGSSVLSGDNILIVEDDAGNTRTKYTATMDCVVTASWTCYEQNSSSQNAIYKNGTVAQYGSRTTVSNNGSTVTYTTKLSPDDFLSFGGDLGWSSTNNVQLNITAQAQELQIVGSVTEAENVFSAVIKNDDSPADTASILSQSSDFIQSVNRSGEGIVDVTYKTGIFTQKPSVVAMATEGNTIMTTQVVNSSVTGFSFRSNDTASPYSGADRTFSFIVMKQGNDYKNIQDVVATVFTPKVAYCRMLSSDADVSVGSNTTVSLSSTDGDTEIVNLSGDDFTLQPGKYEIDWSFTMWTNGTGESVGSCQLYNVSDNTVERQGTAAAGDGNNYGTLAPSTGSTMVNYPTAKTFRIRANNIRNSGSHTLYVGYGTTGLASDKGWVRIRKIN